MQINKLQSAMISIRLLLSDEDPLAGWNQIFLWLPVALAILLLGLTPALGVLVRHDTGQAENWIYYAGGVIYPSAFTYALVVLISYIKAMVLWVRATLGYVATGFIWLLSLAIPVGGGGFIHFDSHTQLVFLCAGVLQGQLFRLFH